MQNRKKEYLYSTFILYYVLGHRSYTIFSHENGRSNVNLDLTIGRTWRRLATHDDLISRSSPRAR